MSTSKGRQGNTHRSNAPRRGNTRRASLTPSAPPVAVNGAVNGAVTASVETSKPIVELPKATKAIVAQSQAPNGKKRESKIEKAAKAETRSDTALPKVEAKESPSSTPTPERPTLPDAPALKDAKVGAVESTSAAKKEPANKAEAKTAEPPSDPDPLVDEVSIPPIGDLDDERFFAEGTRSERELLAGRAIADSDVGLELDASDPKAEHKMRPEVRARRAKFASYVKMAVAGAAVLCLAAVVRARGNHDASLHETHVTSAAAAEVAPPAAEVALVAPQAVQGAVEAPAEPTQGADPKAAAPAADEVKPADEAKADPKPAPAEVAPQALAAAAPAAAAAAEGTVADAPPEKTAAEEKRDSRVALERGSYKKAIEAGERSVALDATDGEAWLMLGAAYQTLGRAADARRSFVSCLKEGKKGPLSECKAMLQ